VVSSIPLGAAVSLNGGDDEYPSDDLISFVFGANLYDYEV
jgi:hypothetical protein